MKKRKEKKRKINVTVAFSFIFHLFIFTVSSHLQRLGEQRQVVQVALGIMFQLELSKFPSEILALSVGDFCFKYQGSFEVYHEVTSRAEMERAEAEEELSLSIRRSGRKRSAFSIVQNNHTNTDNFG